MNSKFIYQSELRKPKLNPVECRVILKLSKCLSSIQFFLVLILTLNCNQIIEPFFIESTVKLPNPKVIYKLSGIWKFSSTDTILNTTGKIDDEWDNIQVPGYWINSGFSNRNIGWYRVQFIPGDAFKNKDLAIIIKNALNSHELYINGVKIGGIGEIISEREVIKNARPVVHFIPSNILTLNKPNIIAIRLADDVGGGGLVSPPMICEKDLCEREFQVQSMILGGVIFFFIFIGIYNILIYLGNSNDKSYLFFGISIISFSFVTLGNERYTYTLTENYVVHFYIFHPFIYACSIFSLLTVNYFFDVITGKFSKFLISIYLIVFILSIISGSNPEFRKIYNGLIVNYEISFLNLLLGGEMIRIILKARSQKKAGNFFVLLGSLSLIVSISLLLFYLIGHINRTFLNEGFFLMISSFALAFAVRYKKLRDHILDIELKNSIELESLVNLKTKELVEINKKLSDSNNIKDKLFSIISHDLKTPLYALEETLNLFKNKQMTKTSLLKYIRSVNSILETNKFLLENLLSWSVSQMRDSQLILEKIDPRPILLEVYALHESFATSKKIHIKINPISEVYCIADRNALRLVLRNLISNSIKFTPRNGLILLDIEKQESTCSILIQDNGIGMNSETQKNLFQYQRDRISLGTEQERGSGLGLYICREFVEKMNGKISLQSESGKGTRFYVELPLFQNRL